MINFRYSLIIEATADPNFFGFYSPELEGFSGVGRSIEDCIAKSRVAMEEHVTLLEEAGLPVPATNLNPTVIVQNSERIIPAA